MATALTPGKLYFIESVTDDWIADHAGDPDDIDLDGLTEGIDYLSLIIPEMTAQRGKTGAIVTPSGAGESYDKRKEERFYNTIVTGIEQGRTRAGLVDKFFMSPRHTSGASATFKRYHLIHYFGTDDHVLFTDANGTQQSYCTGIVTDYELRWVSIKNQLFVVRSNFWSVWEK